MHFNLINKNRCQIIHFIGILLLLFFNKELVPVSLELIKQNLLHGERISIFINILIVTFSF